MASAVPRPALPDSALGVLTAATIKPWLTTSREGESAPTPAQLPAREEPWLTGSFMLAAAAHFAHNFAYHSYLHFPGKLELMGADAVMIGLVVAVLSATAVLGRPFAGWLIDARGRRVTMLIGGVLHVLACAAYLLVSQLGPLLFAVRILHGAAIALVFPAFFTWVVDGLPEKRRAQGIALFGVSGLLPLSLGPLLGDFLVRDGHYEQLFYVTTGSAALGLLLSVFLGESKRTVLLGEVRRGYLQTIRAPDLLPLWFMSASFAAALAGYFAFVKNYTNAFELGGVGSFFSAYAWAAIAVRVLTGRLHERVGLRPLLLCSLLCVALSLWITAAATGWWTLALAGALCGAGHGYSFPLLSTLVVERAKPSERGTAIALFSALFEMGVLVGAPVFGLIVQVSGYSLMYVAAGSGLALAVLVFARWETGREQGAAAPAVP